MRKLYILVFVALACRESPKSDGHDSPITPDRETGTDDSTLMGTWTGTLYLRSPSPRTPNPTEHEREFVVVITRDTGYFEAVLTPMIGKEPPDPSVAVSRHEAADSVWLSLGGCCDNGDLALRGKLAGDSIIGRWSQVFYEDGAYGDFLLRRQ